MYRRKIVLGAIAAVGLVVVAALLALWAVRATEANMRQAEQAHSLLAEHLQLSVHAYRLFKQLTDEVLLGAQANQSVARNKRAAIARSLARIRLLELQQRADLGTAAVPGAVEDTDGLEALIDTIVRDFEALLALPPGTPRPEQVAVILEDRIDVSFREAVNAALERQRGVVTRMQAQVRRVHGQLLAVSLGLAALAVLGALAAGASLVRGLSRPLAALQQGASAIGRGDFAHRVPQGYDAEFDAMATAFNAMAAQLAQHDAEREDARRALEAAVGERTVELTRANAELQRADAARRHFFADVSHELRTPLTIIRGEAQVALRAAQRPPEELREALRSVLDQAVGLSRLVDDMLFIARADAQAVRLQRRSIDLAALNEELLRDLRGQAQARDVRLEAAPVPAPGQLVADPDRLRQLLLTLLDNALRYSPPQGRVRLRWEHAAQGWMATVEDEGPGIDPSDLPHVFDRFFRGAGAGEPGRSDGGAGLGLGLAVARAIAQAHGGDIEADSAPGQGTRMRLRLPAD